MRTLVGIIFFAISTMCLAHQYHSHHGDDEKPSDSVLITQVQSVMQQARQGADERLYERARRLLDRVDEPSKQALLYRAEIQQYFHQFDQALVTLDAIGQNLSADMLRAGIYFTQGKFEQAQRQCKQLFGRADTLLALTCSAHANSLQGELVKAYKVLAASIEHIPAHNDAALAWAYVTLAEMSERQADYEAAKRYYRLALAINANDIPTRLAYADILLQQEKYQELVRFSEGFLTNDLLAVRYLRALNHIDRDAAARYRDELEQRIQHYDQARRHLHFDLLAEFNLYFKDDLDKALYWAKRHWQQQKTPRDARLLAYISRLTGDLSAEQSVKDWQRKHHLQDEQLDRLLQAKSQRGGIS